MASRYLGSEGVNEHSKRKRNLLDKLGQSFYLDPCERLIFISGQLNQ